MAVRTCVLLLLSDASVALRRSSNKAAQDESFWPWRNKAKHIACPVMGALVNNGQLELDSQGRVTQADTARALMWTGNSVEMAGFQARGIAAFKGNDTHQEYRERGGGYAPDQLYLNYNTWNPLSECDGSNPTTRDGMACNTNIGFQQHGFSTTLRDPTDGSSAKSRWSQWMDLPGVLTNIPGVREKVMTMAGLGALLREARLNGNKDGEFGLTAENDFKGSPLSFYHPSASAPTQFLPCSQWQGVGAWAAFWALFARYQNDISYMPVSDLRRFFFDAKFPRDWSPKPWGFRESFKVVRELKGMGAGEEWVAIITGILDSVGEDAEDKYYAAGMLQALASVGARDDDVFRRYPR